VFSSLNARALGLDLSPDETIDLAFRHGFGGVDLLVRDLVDSGADALALRRRMDDHGLQGGAWPLPVHWRGSVEEYERDLARLPRLAETAAVLGLMRTCTWVMPETPASVAHLPDVEARREATARLHVERVGAIARALDAHGVRLGLEVIGVASFRKGVGDPFVTRLADLDARLGPLWREAPNLGVLVDGFHLYAAGEPPEAGLAWGAGRVVWVHVADLPKGAPANREAIRDQDRGLPGENPVVETGRLLQTLQDAGYEGPVTPEPMPGCRSLAGLTPVEAVVKVALALRSVWPDRALPGQ